MIRKSKKRREVNGLFQSELLVAKRARRVEAGGAPRRHESCPQGSCQHGRDAQREDRRVGGFDAEELAFDEAPAKETRRNTGRDSKDNDRQHLPQDEPDYVASFGA